MTSKILASAILAAAAMTSLAASADPLNPYLWEQMKTPSTKTRAEVRAELLSAPPVAASSTSSSDSSGMTAAKTGPSLQTRPALVKTGAP